MSIKLLVRQGGGAAAQPDIANLGGNEGAPIFDGQQSLIEMGHRWEQGTASRGAFTSLDPEALLTYKFRPHASVKLIEDDSGSDVILAWHRIEGGNDVGREWPGYTPGDAVKHINVQTMDANLDLRGIPFKNTWSRPAEDSWERLQALHAAKLNGSSSTADIHRSTTNITVDRFSNGHLVDATSPVDLDAKDYPAGTTVEDVMRDIMEQWGMGWGVTIHHTGGSHKCLLVQELDDLAKFTSDLRISDQLADYDPTDLTAPVLEPIWRRAAGKTSDNSATISGLISVYGGTADDPRHLYVETGEAPEDWELWVDVYNDDLAENETQATRRANNILNDRKRPYITNQPSILLLPEQVTLITAGQAIEVKSVVMNQGPDKHNWVWRRIAEVRWEPNYDGRWWAHLELDRPRNSRPAAGGGQPKSTTPKPAPNCTPSGTEILHNHINDANDTCFPGTYNTSDGDPFFDSFAPAKAMGSGGAEINCGDGGAAHGLWDDLTPGETYGFSIDIADKNGQAPGKSIVILEKNAADATIATHTYPIGGRSSYTKYTISGSFGPLNAAYDHAHFVWPTFLAKWYRNVVISQTTGGDDEPGCIDYVDTDVENPGIFMPAEEVIARDDVLDERIDAVTVDVPRVYNVENYGAVHDGTTDDTAAIQAAIDAWETDGRNGIIYFPRNLDRTQGVYLVSGALQDTSTFNSQLKIPQGSSGTIRFVGPATIRSDWDGSISGNPAIISAGLQDSLTLNQVFILFDQMRFEVKANPKLTAIQVTKAATCRWTSLSIAPYESYTASVPTNTNAIGLDLPYGMNDQNSGGGELYVDGFYTAVRPSEQMVADAIYASYCARAVEMRGAEGAPDNLAHSVSIQRLNVWFCVRGIVATGDLRTLHVGLMDVEHNDPAPFATVYDVDDTSNFLRGFIRWHTTDYTTGAAIDDPLINGALGLSFHGGHAKRWKLNSVVDIPTGTDPATNPGTGRRMYADSATGNLTVRKPDGTTVDLESGGSVTAAAVKAVGRWEPVTAGVDTFVWSGSEIIVTFVET